ncbi:S49 family peptidase [Roseibium suaedae]|uniref:Protein C Serine peptidase. MEROPS family S49 n=1 Tax=Roseibium suaedae TaxID=735517 RepID=A0A1M7PLY5_9HYPH|nr:S49 family peptidase [Roseibium suaedae]SHN18291.1 protein C Serine peptidase. MEROPS family S49 [Roseibium suaedae]
MIELISPCQVALAEEHGMAFAHAMQKAASVQDQAAGFTWLEDCRTHDLYEVIDGVGVIVVSGILVDELPFHGASWITGYNGIRAAVACALGDASVKVVALLINSPGGMVRGCFELTEYLRSAGEEKPLMAIVKGMATSAAYAVAACAEVISVPQTGTVGSIGVYRMHVDCSEQLKASGLKVTFAKAGGQKTDGNPYEPLSDDVKQRWDEVVEAERDLFAQDVALGRGITKEAVLATEAALFEGPVNLIKARDLGLIDLILPPAAAFSRLREAAAKLN